MDNVELEIKAYDAQNTLGKLRRFDSALLTRDWIEAMIARGYGWHLSIGAFSTPITGGGAGTILDLDQPEGSISVPTGYALLPLRIHVQCQVPLLAADSDEEEILIALDRTAKNAGDGTFTAETLYNMRTDITAGPPITATSAYTADVTDPVLDLELARAVIVGDVQGTAANALWTQLACLYEPLHPPLIIGPAAIWIYWGGTVALPGFAQAQVLAFPSALLTGLV
jgi:hypothetical protein